MTLQELFNWMGDHPMPFLLYFTLVPLTAFVISTMSDRYDSHLSPWKHLYATLVYLSCLPGIFAVTMCLYHLFIDKRSLLQLNVLAYFLPIVSMAVTLLLISRKVAMSRLPGFDKLGGLMMMIAATFITILIVQKTHIWIYFRGSSTHLLFLFIGLFLLFRWGMSRIFAHDKMVE